MEICKECPNTVKTSRNTYCSRICAAKPRIGVSLSEETKKKLSKANRGVSWGKHTEEWKEHMRGIFKGKPKTKEHIENVRIAKRKTVHLYNGANCHLWRGGITQKNRAIRNSWQYKEWRRDVFERDDYTCQECGIRSGKGVKVTLNADHIKPFSLFPKLRFELSNGRTLCLPCHRETDTFMSKIKTYEKQLS